MTWKVSQTGYHEAFKHISRSQIPTGTLLDLFNVLRTPFCTLTTHSWLNWVDEDD